MCRPASPRRASHILRVAQVHIFGCIDAASCFPTRGRALQVRWRLEFDSNVEVIAGPTEGLTKVAEVESEDAIIDEPIDVHLNVTSLLRGGPPRLVIDVWHEDDNARFELSGYGFAHLPVAPGAHDLQLVCWRPWGTSYERLSARLPGTSSYPTLSRRDTAQIRTETTGRFHAIVVGSASPRQDEVTSRVTRMTPRARGDSRLLPRSLEPAVEVLLERDRDGQARRDQHAPRDRPVEEREPPLVAHELAGAVERARVREDAGVRAPHLQPRLDEVGRVGDRARDHARERTTTSATRARPRSPSPPRTPRRRGR